MVVSALVRQQLSLFWSVSGQTRLRTLKVDQILKVKEEARLRMIPLMLLYGLVLGRWWRFALISAGVVWPVLLWVGGIFAGLEHPWQLMGQLVLAVLLAVINAGVGVALYQGVLYVIRRVSRRSQVNQPGGEW